MKSCVNRASATISFVCDICYFLDVTLLISAAKLISQLKNCQQKKKHPKINLSERIIKKLTPHHKFEKRQLFAFSNCSMEKLKSLQMRVVCL